MHDSIVYVANPKACLKLITVKYKTTPNFKITFINGLLVILYIIGVFATDASIKLLDNESDKVFRSIYIIGGIVIPCALFILCAFFRRRLYMKDVVDDVKTIDEVIGIAARLTEEEDPSYVSIKSFQTIKEAEDAVKLLEENGIPSKIYGAVKPDYISRERLPIQVLVTRHYEAEAKRLLPGK